MKYFTVLFVASLFFGCSSPSQVEEQEKKLTYKEMTTVQRMENRHKKEKFLSFDNIKFDLELYFRGKKRLSGTLTLATNSSKGLIETKDGNKVLFINDKVYYTPGMNEKKVRFDAYTWSYFFLLPYKLSDEGTIWTETEKVIMNESWFKTQRLVFADGTGDAPDDWYQVYSDTNTDLIQVAAYIVTANKSVEKAEEDPHAIGYENYEMLEAIPIATKWGFYGWRPSKGLTDTIGNATLSNFEFVEDNDSLYSPPSNFLSI